MFPFPVNLNSLSHFDNNLIVLTVSFATYLAFHVHEYYNPLPVATLLLFVPAALSGLSFLIYDRVVAIPVTFLAHWTLVLLFTALYRASPFHPLAKYPGPFLHKLSKFKVLAVSSKGIQHHHYQKLHRKYGDIVRVGPNELSYCNVDGVALTLGVHGLPKGPFYKDRETEPPLINMQDTSQHVQRRKPWNRAFNSDSLKGYESILVRRSRELVEAFSKRQSEAVDMARWMEYFAWDFMGEMGFSFAFDLMKEGGDPHDYLKTIMEATELVSMVSHIPWATKFMTYVVNPGGRGLKIRELSGRMVGQRLKSDSVTRDLFYHLSNEDGKQTDNLTHAQLFSEGVITMVAGSDTTSTVLSNLWYYLLQNPAFYARLRKEVDAAFPSGEEPLDQRRLAEMPFLHACLNESMRLQPPVPSGSQRAVLAGTGGKMVGPHFVAEGNNIIVHTYSLHRDSRYFSPFPNTFWPDRWLSSELRVPLDGFDKPLDPEVILNTSAFIPFSSGPRICAGKSLAMNEMRVIASFIVQRFDIKVAPGYDLNQWEKELEDFFILKKGKLPVLLTKRVC